MNYKKALEKRLGMLTLFLAWKWLKNNKNSQIWYSQVSLCQLCLSATEIIGGWINHRLFFHCDLSVTYS